MRESKVRALKLCSYALLLLWVNPAYAGIGGAAGAALGAFGGGSGGGFGALSSLQSMISGNIATVAGIAVLGIGMFLAFAKSSWMELVGSLAFIATLGICVTWVSSNTGMFFGSGACL